MRRKKNREINVFSLSAVDLFASALGVFIIVTVILIPYMKNREKRKYQVMEQQLKNQVNALQMKVKTQEKTPAQESQPKEEQVKTLSQKVIELQQKVQQQEREQKVLNSQLEQSKTPQDKSGAFMVAIIKWSSPKHDVDLQVQDPQGKIFDFKNREHKGSSGALILDTRTGPGVEVWQASKLVAGEYRLRYLFYGSYGNASPVSVEGTIITPPGATKLPKIVMKKDKEKSPWMRVLVSGDGKIKIL